MSQIRCTEAMRRGRLQKGRQFLEAASMIGLLADESDLIDAHITLCVHAGIAAADVICCARLGIHASGQKNGGSMRRTPLSSSIGGLITRHNRRSSAERLDW